MEFTRQDLEATKRVLEADHRISYIEKIFGKKVETIDLGADDEESELESHQ